MNKIRLSNNFIISLKSINAAIYRAAILVLIATLLLACSDAEQEVTDKDLLCKPGKLPDPESPIRCAP